MKVVRSPEIMQNKMLDFKHLQIGLIPTMGFFHEGHISLIKKAKEENDIIVTSIFVNPLQFGPNEDYEQYPRNEEQDIKLATDAGVDVLFIPDVQGMYPAKMLISLASGERSNVLCGRSRPGHFDGVITVLTKLFNIIQPTKTYFGMKDAQQVAVVAALIKDLNFPIELVGLPTVREKDGLAKSSRNIFLSKNEREEAVWLFKALTYGKKLVVDGEMDPVIIVKEVIDIITKKTTSTIDYVELLSFPGLQPVSIIDQQVIIAVAVQFKQVRLIDNLLLNKNGSIVNRLK